MWLRNVQQDKRFDSVDTVWKTLIDPATPPLLVEGIDALSDTTGEVEDSGPVIITDTPELISDSFIIGV